MAGTFSTPRRCAHHPAPCSYSHCEVKTRPHCTCALFSPSRRVTVCTKLCVVQVRTHLVRLEETPSDLPQQAGYRTGLLDLRRNRFVVRETVEGLTAAKAKKRKKARWRLETSCWAPRKASGNSLDFFETSKAMRRLFDIDWSVASKAHELSWYVLRALLAIVSRRCMPTCVTTVLMISRCLCMPMCYS